MLCPLLPLKVAEEAHLGYYPFPFPFISPSRAEMPPTWGQGCPKGDMAGPSPCLSLIPLQEDAAGFWLHGDKQQEVAESIRQQERTQGKPCPRLSTKYALSPSLWRVS